MNVKAINLVLPAYLLIGIFTIFFFNGTGDQGDSVLHFLFAKYAPQHPELFFNHWAKPLFVLLASPFAQFGFTGIKFFNLFTTLLTIFFTYKTARLFQFKNATVSALFIICAPMVYQLTFSGLTEPLFALFLILGLYFTRKEQTITAAGILSFLPFVRSEGLIFLGVFGFFYLIKKDFKAIPFLALGHAVYSIAGFFIYHDFFWIFNKIPYATLNSTYGDGRLFHFVTQLNFVLGIPVYLLLWLGLIQFLRNFITRRLALFSAESILILGGFLAFFMAHSLFWYLGIFNSMGLKRVFIGVMPLIALIALKGFNLLAELPFRHTNVGITIKTVLVLAIVIFPFLKNRAAVSWSEMYLSTDQRMADDLENKLNTPEFSGRTFFYAHPYLSMALHRDHFDLNQHRNLTREALKNLRKGDLVIWDNWFAVIENGIEEDMLDRHPGLIYRSSVTGGEEKRKSRFSIYQVQ